MTCMQSTPDGNTNNTHSGRYRIFLLTCWLEDDAEWGDPNLWRFRLEEPRSKLRRGCVGLRRLVALLGYEIADEVDLISGVCKTTK